MRFNCPKCNKSLKVADTMAGRRGKCPSCGQLLTVPLSGAAEDTQQGSESQSRSPHPRCGKTRDSGHVWDGCKCTGCGATRDAEHAWSGDLRCTRCGKQQFSDVKYKEREVTDGNTYIVHTASSKARAMQFLRATVVKEERKYLIVETPEGSFGKDLVMIFDERTSARIEFGARNPLPTLTKSRTHCARCGYPVLPAGASIPGATELIVLDKMKEDGVGFFCSTCQTAWCPFCVSTTDLGKCDLCGEKMRLFRE